MGIGNKQTWQRKRLTIVSVGGKGGFGKLLVGRNKDVLKDG